jgi:hypothetical protein
MCNHCLTVGHRRRACSDFLAGRPSVRHSQQGRQDGNQQGKERDITNEQLLDALAKRLQLSPQGHPPRPHNTAPGAGSARMYADTAIAGMGDDECLVKDSDTMWLDRGSTHHIVCSRDKMVNCTAGSSVLAAGGKSHEMLCCGLVHLQSTNGIQVKLSDVLCVPTFKINLVSEQNSCQRVSASRKSATKCR